MTKGMGVCVNGMSNAVCGVCAWVLRGCDGGGERDPKRSATNAQTKTMTKQNEIFSIFSRELRVGTESERHSSQILKEPRALPERLSEDVRRMFGIGG